MNCRECRDWIDDLLLRDPDEAPPSDIARHLADCNECAREHALALETLEAITPRGLAVASPRFKERLMATIPTATLDGVSAVAQGVPHRLAPRHHPRTVRSVLAVALAASVVLAMILFPIGNGLAPSSKDVGFSLLAQASAAEARLFLADEVVSLASEIVAEPVADAGVAEGRWLPLLAVGADGKTRFHQLKLGGPAGEGYAIRDEAWYDPATHRFAHVLTLKGLPVFANAYDGRSVHLMELDDQGRPRVEDKTVAVGFEPPKDPGHFLGILGVVLSANSEEDLGRRDLVRDEGPVKLPDGTPAHALRVTFSEGGSGVGIETYGRVTIRDDTHRVVSLEFFASGKKIYTLRRVEAAGPREPRYGWDLAGLRPAIEKEKAGPKLPVQTLADMFRFDVSPDDMAKRADYPVYVFERNPSWSTRRQIVDILDVATPPHRMFASVYPAKDRRHVVFVQAHTFNANLAPMTRTGKLLYTSPAGFKVWSTRDDKAMAKILLSSIGSTRLIFSDTPAKDCTGYVLETPDGTFPALAVNGVLTEAELHGLADSLVRVRAK
jgi:hypothetical protein